MKSDRPIDAMIAEHVMQTEKYWAIRWGGSGYGDFPTYDQAVIHAMKLFGDRRAAIIPYWDEPHYSTSIAAAWQVVEKLARDGKHLALQAPGSTDMNECYRTFPKWTADFAYCGSTEAQADTAPLAICLAALAACGVDVESPK